MTEPKFTPGPWKTTLPNDCIIQTHDGEEVAETVGNYSIEYSQMEANARLIAAAPDMFAALQAYIAADTHFHINAEESYKMRADANRMTRPILAKLESET